MHIYENKLSDIYFNFFYIQLILYKLTKKIYLKIREKLSHVLIISFKLLILIN